MLETEFLSGYSGARTFLALPIRADGGPDAHTIVKIGWREDIRREAENYETFVRHSLPPMTARIQHAPVTAAGSRRAAIQYTFIAEPGRPPVSLRQALLANPGPRPTAAPVRHLRPGLVDAAPPRLVPRLRRNMTACCRPTWCWSRSKASAAPLVVLSAHSLPSDLALAPGQFASLGRFKRVEPRADGVSYTLVGAAQPGQPALRLRWPAPLLGGLALLPPEHGAIARVVSTRETLLAGLVDGLDLFGLPDPLARLPGLLDRMLPATRSIIHGDLNLENVLVGPGGFVWLIDFAQTREGHPLFDFAHLAAEVIAHVIAPDFSDPAAYLDALSAGRLALLAALESIAARCLFNPADPSEYHLALFFSCLGALKYANLDRHQKQLLYLTAAWLGTQL